MLDDDPVGTVKPVHNFASKSNIQSVETVPTAILNLCKVHIGLCLFTTQQNFMLDFADYR